MRNVALAWIVAPFLAGCTSIGGWHPATRVTQPVDQGVFNVCLDIPRGLWPAAHVAVDKWDHALHMWKHVEAIDGGYPPTFSCSVWVRETTGTNAENPASLAWASTVGGVEIDMKKGRYEHDVPGILMHELGHVFGAQHVPGTLMDPVWAPHRYMCPDATTVAQVAAWNQFDLGLLSWCNNQR